MSDEEEPAAAGEPYVLCLFVTGQTRGSLRAVESVRKLCEQHLAGRYSLEVVDMYQQPERLQDEQIVASPTLVRKRPLPARKLVGRLSDPRRVLEILGAPFGPPP